MTKHSYNQDKIAARPGCIYIQHNVLLMAEEFNVDTGDKFLD